MTTVRLDQAALQEIRGSVAALAACKKVGDEVAQRAAEAAPKRTPSQGGAASIHAEEVNGEIRVGWDRDHFYMLFHEVGTSAQSARPFLRPALDAQYDV